MTGPKHLWSGNWQDESSDPPTEVARPDAPSAELPIRRPGPHRRGLLLPVLAGLLVVAVALALVLPGGSRSHRPTSSTASVLPAQPPQTIPATGTPTQPLTGVTGRLVNWLGMQISTVQGSGAVIQTVALGSPADAAGLDPGDILQTVNGRPISEAGQIIPAVAGLKAGHIVPITVERGSTMVSTAALVRGHPTTSP